MAFAVRRLPGLVPYADAWAQQRELHALRVGDDAPDTVLLLEHEPVYTAGRRTAAWERPDDGTDVVDVDRGGRITWHGPGQLTGYPIVRLPQPVDVVAHVRRLEEALINACADIGVTTVRITGRSGVWAPADDRGPDRKVAAIGVRVSRGVTMHGFALNCDCDLTAFDRIVPCGITDAGVTSLSRELGRPVSVADVLPTVERHLRAVLAPADPPPAPPSRKLLRLEVRNAETPIERKPPWIKTQIRTGPQFSQLKELVRSEGLHTVCEEAGCPNIYECWEDREATFLIGGDQCTRRCDFCQIDTGRPAPLDRDEPRRVAASVATMGLRYATITGVARDDLPDEGAWLYAETVRQIHHQVSGCSVELLAPDFSARPELLDAVFATAPEVFAHNVETVPRIFRRIRPGFDYERSLGVLRAARDAALVTKSNLILGLGEERDEILATLRDLRSAGCDLVTLTQYLRPSPRHHPVERWVHPDEFVALAAEAEALGFAGVLSGPLVRSSYRAGRLYAQAIAARATA